MYYKVHMGRRSAITKATRRNRERGQRRIIKRFVREYLANNPCVSCNYDEIFALDFDHIDPATKSESICSLTRRVVPIAKIESEIDKCRVICANCHRRRHYHDQAWHRVLTTVNLTKDRKYKDVFCLCWYIIVQCRSC